MADGGWRVGRCVLAAALFAGWSLAATRAAAQTDARLRDAIALVQSGHVDSARAVVQRVLATLAPTDSVYPEALYTAGVLAPDAPTAARYLQRVVVEYGLSPWADDALLRLVQLHAAQGDPAATVQAAERLRRDYPDSPLLARAALPAGRAYFDLRDELRGCAMIRTALAGAADVEFKNQVAFYAARCPAEATPESAAAPVAPPATAPRYAVQVLAVRSVTQVDETLTRLRAMGFDARVVRDTSGLFKVRVGRYATREEAQQMQQRVRARLGGQPFIVEEP
jgi:hypothetical protein